MPRVTGLTVCRWNCHMLVGQFVAFQPAWRADWRLAPGTGSVSVFAPVSCLLSPASCLCLLYVFSLVVGLFSVVLLAPVGVVCWLFLPVNRCGSSFSAADSGRDPGCPPILG